MAVFERLVCVSVPLADENAMVLFSICPKRINLGATISCKPSWLKSPRVIDCGSLPTETSVVPVKRPVPSPKRTETLFVVLLADTMS